MAIVESSTGTLDDLLSRAGSEELTASVLKNLSQAVYRSALGRLELLIYWME